MADFDEKLNSLLSNPEAMSQIMQLAQSLSGGESSATPAPFISWMNWKVWQERQA